METFGLTYYSAQSTVAKILFDPLSQKSFRNDSLEQNYRRSLTSSRTLNHSFFKRNNEKPNNFYSAWCSTTSDTKRDDDIYVTKHENFVRIGEKRGMINTPRTMRFYFAAQWNRCRNFSARTANFAIIKVWYYSRAYGLWDVPFTVGIVAHEQRKPALFFDKMSLYMVVWPKIFTLIHILRTHHALKFTMNLRVKSNVYLANTIMNGSYLMGQQC